MKKIKDGGTGKKEKQLPVLTYAIHGMAAIIDEPLTASGEMFIRMDLKGLEVRNIANLKIWEGKRNICTIQVLILDIREDVFCVRYQNGATSIGDTKAFEKLLEKRKVSY